MNKRNTRAFTPWKERDIVFIGTSTVSIAIQRICLFGCSASDLFHWCMCARACAYNVCARQFESELICSGVLAEGFMIDVRKQRRVVDQMVHPAVNQRCEPCGRLVEKVLRVCKGGDGFI